MASGRRGRGATLRTVRAAAAMSAQIIFAVRPVALAKPDAARALGMSTDSFERYAQADLRVVRRGRLRLYPVAELERWLDENAEAVLPDRRSRP